MRDNEPVWLEPNTGRHYHREGCWMIDLPTYKKLALAQAKIFTRDGYHYIPCACIDKKPLKRL